MSAGALAVGVPAALLFVIGWAMGGDEAPPGGGADRDPYTSPIWTPRTEADLARLAQYVCQCSAGSPEASDKVLAGCVWSRVWPSVPYPPIKGDHASLAEAQARLQEAIGIARGAGYCGATPPSPGPSPTPDPSPSPNDLGPWIGEPAGGRFYQVVYGDQFFGEDGILARALYASTYEAATAASMTAAKAQSRAAAVAADPQARVALLNAIQCSPWNDSLYGTYRHDSNFAGPHGRVVSLTPQNDAVYDRLADGEAPHRLLNLGQPSDVGTTSLPGGKGSTQPLLWIPALDGAALLDVNRSQQVDADGMEWPDGSSTYNPPPMFADLGIDGAPGLPWGCVA